MPTVRNTMYKTVEVRRYITGFKRGTIIDASLKGLSKSSVDARQKDVGTFCYEAGTGDRYELVRLYVTPMLEVK